MGLFIQQNDKRSQLQERLAAELREKAKTSAGGSEPIDLTKNSNYLKDTETASRPSYLWLGVAVAVIATILLFFVLL
jgi:hypothetical protein